MNYEELDALSDKAWEAFFAVIIDDGRLKVKKLSKDLDGKDCFNDVFDCFMNQYKGEDDDGE